MDEFVAVYGTRVSDFEHASLHFLLRWPMSIGRFFDVDGLVNWCERQKRHGSDEVRVRCQSLYVLLLADVYLVDCSYI